MSSHFEAVQPPTSERGGFFTAVLLKSLKHTLSLTFCIGPRIQFQELLLPRIYFSGLKKKIPGNLCGLHYYCNVLENGFKSDWRGVVQPLGPILFIILPNTVLLFIVILFTFLWLFLKLVVNKRAFRLGCLEMLKHSRAWTPSSFHQLLFFHSVSK